MEQPDDGKVEPAPTVAASKGNRLTIGHLLVWTAGTALVLVTFPNDWLPLRSIPVDRIAWVKQLELYDNTEKALTVIFAPLYGSAVAALPIAGRNWLERRGGFPSQPGHWLLLLLGLLYLLVALSAHFQDALIHPPASVAAFLVLASMLSVSVAAVVSVREPTVWVVTFQTALGAVALLVVAWLIAVVDRLDVSVWMFSSVLFASAGVVGLIAALRDLFRRTHYDLFHWLGVSTLAAALATPLLAHGVGAWLF